MTNDDPTTTVAWRRSLEDALAQSRATAKPVLLDFFNPS
jgi:hypothetical protein